MRDELYREWRKQREGSTSIRDVMQLKITVKGKVYERRSGLYWRKVTEFDSIGPFIERLKEVDAYAREHGYSRVK